ncbi:hypothetical protein RchiOBHm_Chr3g0488231 [Rosa chinensis]|uniref:Uncharacterized protein n=1 Tax=Rosa chinensis TaxID=74649 RepID=A0A2P6RFP7_ROSCH|nr:hypothetical protein RchiOBHm_Chr3g0488231 [Rosa chinensis]
MTCLQFPCCFLDTMTLPEHFHQANVPTRKNLFFFINNSNQLLVIYRIDLCELSNLSYPKQVKHLHGFSSKQRYGIITDTVV